MLWDSLRRGLAAGLVAGLAYGLFVALVGNPLVEYLAGHATHAGHDHAGHADAVAELTTAAVSVGSAVLWGLFLGAAFGVAYYLFEPALPGGEGRPYLLALAGFLTVSGVPWLALPPVPPGVGQALSMDTRILIYLGSMGLGALVCALAVAGYNRTRSKGRSVGIAAAAAPFALLAVPVLVVPANALGGLPAELATAYRWLVVLGQLALWLVLAAAYVRLGDWIAESRPVEGVEADLRTAD